MPGEPGKPGAVVLCGDWRGCYDGGWQGLITPESFSHPAKYSRALINRIYQHCIEQGWLKPGDVCLDVFGGVALGALDAQRLGLTWIGIELEEKFVKLGNQNIALWNRRFGHVPGWGSARLLCGDSRKLGEVVAGAGIATGAGGLNTKPGKDGQQSGRNPKSASQQTDQHYGTTAGNLSRLPPGDPAAVISSPPHSVGLGKEHTYADHSKREKDSHRGIMREKGIVDPYYGNTDGQLGNDAADFWSASRVILEQVYAVLKPGGHAVFVTKNFVRAKTIVPFSDQWQALCEAVGFRCVCQHRALLVSGEGEQQDAFGQHKKLRRERKSFFRRLAEAKGSPCINHEDVRCFVK
jgi:hypothetical protein